MTFYDLTMSQWGYLASWYRRVKGDPGPATMNNALTIKLYWYMRFDHPPLEPGGKGKSMIYLGDEKPALDMEWALELFKSVHTLGTYRSKTSQDGTPP